MVSDHVDVLIITALQDELTAVLALGGAGEGGWKATRDRSGLPYHLREFRNDRGKRFLVAAAWSGQLGGRSAVARTQQLIDDLAPASLAMCGICAGDRRVVALGDIIVADQVLAYDEGRSGSDNESMAVALHDMGTSWRIDATYFAREHALSRDLEAGTGPTEARGKRHPPARDPT